MTTTDREAIARIIDPAVWEFGYVKAVDGKNLVKSLTKADAIISLLTCTEETCPECAGNGFIGHAPDNFQDCPTCRTRTEAATGARAYLIERLSRLDCTMVEVCEPHPGNPSRNIIPMVRKELLAALAQPVRVDDHALATSEVVDGETANGDQQDEGGVIQADSDAAADLIESYWTGTGEGYGNMQRLAQAYRDGYTQGVWAKAFAAHRRAFSRERGE